MYERRNDMKPPDLRDYWQDNEGKKERMNEYICADHFYRTGDIATSWVYCGFYSEMKGEKNDRDQNVV